MSIPTFPFVPVFGWKEENDGGVLLVITKRDEKSDSVSLTVCVDQFLADREGRDQLVRRAVSVINIIVRVCVCPGREETW